MHTSFENRPNRRRLRNPATSTENGLDSIFSYMVKSALPTINLHQKETGISLILEMEKLEKTLRVTRFTFVQNPQLEAVSEDLHDAAVIEITLQALIRLFSYAQRHEMKEVLFILPQNEAFQISCFEGLFKEIAPFSLGEEKRVSLTLSCAFQDFFVEQITGIKAKISHELWIRQRENDFLKFYFQNRHKQDFSLMECTSLSEFHSTEECTIIAFPKQIQER